MAKNESKWTEFGGEFVQNTAAGDGSTVSFNTSSNMQSQDAVWISVNGLLYAKGTHYSVLLPNTITFTTAPAVGQNIIVKFLKG